MTGRSAPGRLHRARRPELLGRPDVIVQRVVEGLDERLDGTSFIQHNLKKVFPDHWSFMLGEIALYSFVMLRAHGHVPGLLLRRLPAEPVVYHGPVRAAAGSDGLHGLRLGAAHLVRGPGGPRDAPDPPLGGAASSWPRWSRICVRVFFTGAFRQAPRDSLAARGRRCSCRASAPASPGTRCPTTRSPERDCASPTRRSCRSRWSGRGSPTSSSAASSPAPELMPRLFVLHMLLDPAPAARRDRRPPRARLAPDPHPVPGAGHATEDTVFGTPGLAEVRAEGRRPGVRDVRGAGAPRRALPDQPGLALRTVRALHGRVAGAARLLRRLARGPAPAVAELGVPRVRAHDRRALPARGGRAGHLLHGPRRSGRSSRRARAATTAMHHFAQRPREAPVRGGVGAAASPSSWC